MDVGAITPAVDELCNILAQAIERITEVKKTNTRRKVLN